MTHESFSGAERGHRHRECSAPPFFLPLLIFQNRKTVSSFDALLRTIFVHISAHRGEREREREGIKNKTSRSFELFCEKRKFLFCSWSFDRKETSILLSLSLSLSLAHFPSRLLPPLSARAARSITLSLPCFLNLNCYLLFFFSLFFLGRSCRSRQSPLSSQSPLCRLLPLIKIGIIKKKNYHLSPLAWS